MKNIETLLDFVGTFPIKQLVKSRHRATSGCREEEVMGKDWGEEQERKRVRREGQ